MSQDICHLKHNVSNISILVTNDAYGEQQIRTEKNKNLTLFTIWPKGFTRKESVQHNRV